MKAWNELQRKAWEARKVSIPVELLQKLTFATELLSDSQSLPIEGRESWGRIAAQAREIVQEQEDRIDRLGNAAAIPQTFMHDGKLFRTGKTTTGHLPERRRARFLEAFARFGIAEEFNAWTESEVYGRQFFLLEDGTIKPADSRKKAAISRAFSERREESE